MCKLTIVCCSTQYCTDWRIACVIISFNKVFMLFYFDFSMMFSDLQHASPINLLSPALSILLSRKGKKLAHITCTYLCAVEMHVITVEQGPQKD